MSNNSLFLSTTVHGGTFQVGFRPDQNSIVELVVTHRASNERGFHYLKLKDIERLRDHLTTILQLPTPMYRYTIKEFNGDTHTVISTGTVDALSLDLLRVSTPVDCVLSYELIPRCNDDHCKY